MLKAFFKPLILFILFLISSSSLYGYVYNRITLVLDVVGSPGCHLVYYDLLESHGTEPVNDDTIIGSYVTVVGNCGGGNLVVNEDIINSLSKPVELEVFPNPTSNILNIRYTSKSDRIIKWELKTIFGESVLLYKKYISKASLFEDRVDISNLQSGSYLLIISQGDFVDSKFIVIQ